MSNKIESFSAEAAAARATAAVGSAGTGSARAKEEAATVAAADSVELTGTAVSLQRLEQTLKGSGGSFDAKRVAELRAAIAAGTWQVDAQQVAGGLLNLEQMLGKK